MTIPEDIIQPWKHSSEQIDTLCTLSRMVPSVQIMFHIFSDTESEFVQLIDFALNK